MYVRQSTYMYLLDLPWLRSPLVLVARLWVGLFGKATERGEANGSSGRGGPYNGTTEYSVVLSHSKFSRRAIAWVTFFHHNHANRSCPRRGTGRSNDENGTTVVRDDEEMQSAPAPKPIRSTCENAAVCRVRAT